MFRNTVIDVAYVGNKASDLIASANVSNMPRYYHCCRVQSWFGSVQRELFRNTVIEMSYGSNSASDLLLFANFSQARPNPPMSYISLQLRRPIPTVGNITYAFHGG